MAKHAKPRLHGRDHAGGADPTQVMYANVGDSGTGGFAVADEGSILPHEPTLNFVGAGVTATDDPGNNRTNVTIPQGIRFDTYPQTGNWLYVNTTGSMSSGIPGASIALVSTGTIIVRSGAGGLELDGGDDVTPTGPIQLNATDLGLRATGGFSLGGGTGHGSISTSGAIDIGAGGTLTFNGSQKTPISLPGGSPDLSALWGVVGQIINLLGAYGLQG